VGYLKTKMEEAYKIKNLEKFKKELEELKFIEFDIIEDTGEFLVLDNRLKRKWDKFWNKDWICQVLKDRITKDYWVCFTDCNNFKSLEFEEIISFLKILIDNTEDGGGNSSQA